MPQLSDYFSVLTLPSLACRKHLNILMIPQLKHHIYIYRVKGSMKLIRVCQDGCKKSNLNRIFLLYIYIYIYSLIRYRQQVAGMRCIPAGSFEYSSKKQHGFISPDMAQLIALPWLQVTLENGSNIMESCMRLNATKAFFPFPFHRQR
jgi:hypothetical protein